MNNSLSNQIKNCRDGVVNNPFQGKDKKVLFVCSMGILRSATAARIFADKFNTRCAGTWNEALIPVTQRLLDWADEVVFMTKDHYTDTLDRFNVSTMNARMLNISDTHEHMAPELVKELKEQYGA